jgi:hypothetical protein
MMVSQVTSILETGFAFCDFGSSLFGEYGLLCDAVKKASISLFFRDTLPFLFLHSLAPRRHLVTFSRPQYVDIRRTATNSPGDFRSKLRDPAHQLASGPK